MAPRRMGLLALAATAAAFPANMMEEVARNPEAVARAIDMLQDRSNPVTAGGATKIFEPVPIFDAKTQYIDVGPGSGHEWVAPKSTDLRGPCPGLNAFANHGFLPHDGYATITQFIEATTTVVGMGPQLAAFLAALGASIDGSGLAWSIGGTPTAAQAGALPGGNGISGSHNKYESDASPTRPDLYEYGNDYKTRVSQFQELIDMSPGNKVTLGSLTRFRSKRFDEQIAKNPYFFNGPFTGVLVQPAAYTFIYRFMANHSEANPYGLLDYNVLQNWFGVTGSSGNFKVKQGYERIPENWYRRAQEYPYDNEYFVADVLNAATLYPKFLDIGGNTGKVNTFTGVDVKNLTGGLFNSGTLAKNNNFACLAYEAAAQVKPDVALAAFTALDKALGSLTSSLNCGTLQKIDDSQLQQFPGYTKSEGTAGFQ